MNIKKYYQIPFRRGMKQIFIAIGITENIITNSFTEGRNGELLYQR